MTSWYHVPAREGDRCYDCGAPAIVTLVETFADRESGYQEARSFCASHDPDADEGYAFAAAGADA